MEQRNVWSRLPTELLCSYILPRVGPEGTVLSKATQDAVLQTLAPPSLRITAGRTDAASLLGYVHKMKPLGVLPPRMVLREERHALNAFALKLAHLHPEIREVEVAIRYPAESEEWRQLALVGAKVTSATVCVMAMIGSIEFPHTLPNLTTLRMASQLPISCAMSQRKRLPALTELLLGRNSGCCTPYQFHVSDGLETDEVLRILQVHSRELPVDQDLRGFERLRALNLQYAPDDTFVPPIRLPASLRLITVAVTTQQMAALRVASNHCATVFLNVAQTNPAPDGILRWVSRAFPNATTLVLHVTCDVGHWHNMHADLVRDAAAAAHFRHFSLLVTIMRQRKTSALPLRLPDLVSCPMSVFIGARMRWGGMTTFTPVVLFDSSDGTLGCDLLPLNPAAWKAGANGMRISCGVPLEWAVECAFCWFSHPPLLHRVRSMIAETVEL